MYRPKFSLPPFSPTPLLPPQRQQIARGGSPPPARATGPARPAALLKNKRPHNLHGLYEVVKQLIHLSLALYYFLMSLMLSIGKGDVVNPRSQLR